MKAQVNILTHHKCASAWTVRYLNEFCAINSLKLTAVQYSEKLLHESDIFVSANASYGYLRDRIDYGLHIVRNPLDIVISAYFSHKNTHPIDGWPKLQYQRKVLQEASERDGLFLTLAFLEQDDFYNGAVGPLHALRHWNYHDARFKTVRMEDLVRAPAEVLGAELLKEFPDCLLPSADDFTFEAVAGRKPGTIDENSHYRSGKHGQWLDKMPNAIIEYVRAHYATLLKNFYPELLS